MTPPAFDCVTGTSTTPCWQGTDAGALAGFNTGFGIVLVVFATVFAVLVGFVLLRRLLGMSLSSPDIPR